MRKAKKLIVAGLTVECFDIDRDDREQGVFGSSLISDGMSYCDIGY